MATTDAKQDDNQFINNLYNEIEDEANKTTIKHKTSVDDWIPINAAFRRGDVHFIKGLIMNYEVAINDDRDPFYKASLLHKAAIYGTYEIVQILLSYGANIYVEDKIGQTPFDCARRFGNFHVLELLLLHEMGASSGFEVKQVLTDIQRQNALTSFMLKTSEPNTLNDIERTMIQAMNDRAPFSDDILIISWQYTLKQGQDSIFFSPLKSPLFCAIMAAFESILTNTSDKLGWCWLRNYLMKSTLWYRKHPHSDPQTEEEKKTTDNEQEFDVDGTLFKELLLRVQKESKRQIELRLYTELLELKSEHEEDWNKMMTYNVENNKYSIARQDVIENGLKPEYSDKSFFAFDCAVSFNPRLHYDIALYLNELIMRANIIDDVFQRDVEMMVDQIKTELHLPYILYKRGPVKTMQRSKAKVEGDYFREQFPTAACLMDANHCTIMFNDVNTLIKFLYKFEQQIASGTSSVKGIIRCKNGWNEVTNKLDNLSYTDIKFNVIIEAFGKSIVGEIQFLLDIMSNFKLVAHALYGIERQQEFVSNLKRLKGTMLDKEKQLFTLANHGDSKGLCLYMVNNMITPKQVLTYVDKGGNNILFSICKRNKMRAFLMLRKLASSPAEFEEYITLLDARKWNCVGWSLLSKSVNILRVLMDDYPDLVFDYKHPDERNQRTSLIMACENNNDELLQWIINKCGNHEEFLRRIHVTQSWNWTPLMICCRWQNFECLKLLLDNILDVDEIYTYYCQEGKGGTTAFITCCSSGNEEILKYMINLVKENEIEDYKNKLFQLIFEHQIDHTKTDGDPIKDEGQIKLDETHYDGENAVMYAAKKGHFKCVEMMMDEFKGETQKLNKILTHKTKKGQTVIELAQENKLEEYEKVIQLLKSLQEKK